MDDGRSPLRNAGADMIGMTEQRRAAAHLLLSFPNTGVIEAAAQLLVLDRTVESMTLVCEGLAVLEAAHDYEGQETILWVLSPAWQIEGVDVPTLLHRVAADGSEQARQGAAIAREWLGAEASEAVLHNVTSAPAVRRQWTSLSTVGACPTSLARSSVTMSMARSV